MDLQEYINNAVTVGRKKTLDKSDQLTLGELILKLEPIVEKQKHRIDEGEKEAIVQYDFEYLFPTFFDSWRGAYSELALNYCTSKGPDKELTITEFYNMAKETIGKEFTGWKGGEFTMSKHTPIWIANPGNSGSTALIDVVDDGYIVLLITGLREY